MTGMETLTGLWKIIFAGYFTFSSRDSNPSFFMVLVPISGSLSGGEE